MKSRIAMVWLAALVGCSRVSVEPHDIAPDGVSSAHSSSAATSGGSGGSGDVAWPHSESGTRLKVASYAAEDGSRFTRAEAFDSALGFYCRFVQAIDGSTRCFPLTWTSGLYYADAECARVIAIMPECDINGERYATVRDWVQPGTCQTRAHSAVRIESAPRMPDIPNTVYDKSSTDCSPLGIGRTMVVDVTVIQTSELARAVLEVDGT